MIYLAVSHPRKSYHNLETNPVYLVSKLFSLFLYLYSLAPVISFGVASAGEVYQKPDESVAPNV